MFGINGGELLIIVVIAIVIIGPERLPAYAHQLRDWAVKGRDFVKQSQAALSKEVGSDVDWATLDPRQYDPRRIVRDALLDDAAQPVTTRATGPAVANTTAKPDAAPVDHDAT